MYCTISETKASRRTVRLQIAAGYIVRRVKSRITAIGCARCRADNERGRTRKSKKLRSSFTVRHMYTFPVVGACARAWEHGRSLRKNRSTSDRNLADERVEEREDYRAGAHAFALAFSSPGFVEAVNFFEIGETCYFNAHKTLLFHEAGKGCLLAECAVQLTVSKSLKSLPTTTSSSFSSTSFSFPEETSDNADTN